MYLKDENYTAWENKFFRLVVNHDNKTKLKTVNLKSNHGNKNNNLFTVVFNAIGIIALPKYQSQLESINEILASYGEIIVCDVVTIKHSFTNDFDVNTNMYKLLDIYEIYKNGSYFRNITYEQLGTILQYCFTKFGD